jgi:hypothetical protein
MLSEVVVNTILALASFLLISARVQIAAILRRAMNDLIFVGVVAVFFVVSALYVRFCEKL